MKKLLISLSDPEILNPKVSPLFKTGKLQGFLPVDFWQSMEFGRKQTDPLLLQDPLMQQLAKNFSQSFPPVDYTHPPSHPRIPPLIHFIWLGSPLPSEFAPTINTWANCHPGWEIKIWTDATDFSWSSGYSQWLFENATNLGEKADIWRYEILYQFGGIYSDLDVICYKSFNDLIAHWDFIGGQETNKTEDSNGLTLYMSNALFGVSKGHPMMKYCLENIQTQDEAPQASIMERTGPFLLTKACRENLGEHTLVLPCSYFYPLPHFKDLSHKTLTGEQIYTHYLSPESMALHLWAATWYID